MIARLLFFLTGLAAVAAESDTDSRKWSVRAEWMAVSVPAEVALRLVPTIRNPRTAPQAIAELETMIANGTATLHGRPVLWMSDKTEGEMKCVEELRFPTEEVPFAGGQSTGNATILPAPPRILPSYPGIDVPRAIETRNLGLTLEIEPMVSRDGRTVTVNISTQHNWLKHWNRVLDKPGATGGIFEQPQIRTFKTTTSIDVLSGEWALLGIFAGATPAGQIELSLLRVTAISPTP
jgi:hypothetical protein